MCIFPPCICPLHVPVPSVCMSLHVYIPSMYMSPPCVCPLHVYVLSMCTFPSCVALCVCVSPLSPPCVCPPLYVLSMCMSLPCVCPRVSRWVAAMVECDRRVWKKIVAQPLEKSTQSEFKKCTLSKPQLGWVCSLECPPKFCAFQPRRDLNRWGGYWTMRTFAKVCSTKCWVVKRGGCSFIPSSYVVISTVEAATGRWGYLQRYAQWKTR